MMLHALALIHSIWQGLAIGAVCGSVLSLLPHRPAARHTVALAGLVGQLVLFLGTFVYGISADIPGPIAVTGTRVLQVATPSAWTHWMVLLWGTGVVLMALRLVLGVRHTRKLRALALALPEEVSALLTELARPLGLSAVRAGLCEAASGPRVVGVLSPVLLIPSSTLVCLSPAELRAVLTHELAHLARHDPLTQAAREAITMLFFHHPVTWWLSRTARRACEHACDDVAARHVGKKAIASALFELETYRTSTLALGAAGEQSSRVRRLVRPPARSQPRAAGGLATAAVILMVAAPAIAGDRAAERQYRRLERQTERYLELDIQVGTAAGQASMAPAERARIDNALRDALIAKADALEELEAAAVRVVELDSRVWSPAATTQLGSAYEDMEVALAPYTGRDDTFEALLDRMEAILGLRPVSTGYSPKWHLAHRDPMGRLVKRILK